MSVCLWGVSMKNKKCATKRRSPREGVSGALPQLHFQLITFLSLPFSQTIAAGRRKQSLSKK